MIGLMVPNAFADYFQVESKCEGTYLVLTIVDSDGISVQNVIVRTADGIRPSSHTHDTFFSNESGEVTIGNGENTGYVHITKGGFRDQRITVGECDAITVSNVPPWIKTTGLWWVSGIVNEDEFLAAMRFLIKENIIIVDIDKNLVSSNVHEIGQITPQCTVVELDLICSETSKIPDWVKTTIKWWADDEIDDNAFLECMKFLVVGGIIDLSENQDVEEQWFNEPTQNHLTNNPQSCPSNYPYLWSDGNCWNTPEDYQVETECSSDYPYKWENGQCYNLPECTASNPYRYDDGMCYNLPECKGDYPYRTSDGRCSSQPECPASHPYPTSDGFCAECPESHPYKWSDGGCYNSPEQKQATCPAGSSGPFYTSSYEPFCCPGGYLGYPDGTCRK